MLTTVKINFPLCYDAFIIPALFCERGIFFSGQKCIFWGVDYFGFFVKLKKAPVQKE